jgi:hypothetical protein
MRSLALRARAWLALGAFLASLALPFLAARHLTFDDDAACGVDELTLGHAGLQLEASRPSPVPGHCALCHWLRAVGGAHPGDLSFVATWLEPIAYRPALVRQGHDVLAVSDRPSRAPPAAIL